MSTDEDTLLPDEEIYGEVWMTVENDQRANGRDAGVQTHYRVPTTVLGAIQATLADYQVGSPLLVWSDPTGEK